MNSAPKKVRSVINKYPRLEEFETSIIYWIMNNGQYATNTTMTTIHLLVALDSWTVQPSKLSVTSQLGAQQTPMTDVHSSSGSCQKMILTTGAYLRPCTVKCNGHGGLSVSQATSELEHRLPTCSSTLVFDKLYIVLSINTSQLEPEALLWNRRKTLTEITGSEYA